MKKLPAINPSLSQKLLEKFVSTDGSAAQWERPFVMMKRVMATNTSALISLPLGRRRHSYAHFESKNVKWLWDKLTPRPAAIGVISRQLLDHCYESLPRVPKTIEKECGACHAEGSVEYEFVYEGEKHTVDQDCPVCEGRGKVDEEADTRAAIELVPDMHKYVQVRSSKVNGGGSVFFHYQRIEELRFVADLLALEVRVLQLHPADICLFEIGQAEVMVMPCTEPYEEDIIADIDLDVHGGTVVPRR